MQKIILFILISSLPSLTFSQEKSWGYKGYSGGMFVHLGYVQSKHFTILDLQCNVITQQVKGLTYGMGGKMAFYLNTYFRVGGEGYFSTCKYGEYKNSCRIGWGGVTFDLLYPVKKWAPFIGVTLGGGSATHLIFTEKQQNNQDITAVVHFSNPLSIINPAVGVEFFASNRISLLFKMDYMINTLKNPYYPQGVRFYLGVHFSSKKINNSSI